MEYILGVLVISLALLLAQRYLPPKWQSAIQWSSVIILVSCCLQVAVAPYRLARIWHDLTHLLG